MNKKLWQSLKGQAFIVTVVLCGASFAAPVDNDVKLTLAAAVAAGLPILIGTQGMVDRERERNARGKDKCDE